MSERPIAEIIKSCDAYIEFAEARRVFSDVGFYKELKDTIQSLKADNEKLREIAKAVAHIGMDFGYGEYELEQKHIDAAREIMKEGDL